MPLINVKHVMYESYFERMTVKQWKKILLVRQDKFIFQGQYRQLEIANRLGSGIVEVHKKPINR